MASLALKANGTLLHRQLFMLLRQQIASGEYRSGDRLPTQEALCEQFSVSRITVRRALADLQAEGLIRNEQGVGAFVTAADQPRRDAATLSYVEGLRRVVEETEVEVVSIGLVRCPRQIAELLNATDENEALQVVRIRTRENIPVMLLEAWIPKRFKKLVTAKALKSKPLYQLITRGGEELGRVVQEINADLADPVIAQALKISLNSPVLRISRLVYNRFQEPVQLLIVWSTPARSRMLMEIEAKDINTLSTGNLVHDLRGMSLE
jgi:GntR family transcriptional regulator